MASKKRITYMATRQDTSQAKSSSNSSSTVPPVASDTSGQDINDLCVVLAQQIDKMIEERLDKASYDKTYIGMISEVCFNGDTAHDAQEYQRYKIVYNGYEQYIYIRDGLIHSVGDRVKVIIPNGKAKDKYVELLTPNPHPTKIEYVASDGEEDKIIETWTNGVGDTITREYIVKVENKGEENELVTELVFPDGSYMDLRDFVEGLNL